MQNRIKTSFHILRIGLGVTFLWIGILIAQDPIGWGGFVNHAIAKFLPIPIVHIMIATAALDIVLGFFLIINAWVWLVALMGSLHLMLVLSVSGINDVTVRDIGVLAGMISLFCMSVPFSLLPKIFSKKNIL